MKLRAVIIEDEASSREILSGYLERYCPEVELVGEAENIRIGTGLIQKENPDLVFLDVEMPFGNAFDLLEAFPRRGFETVFVTAYDQYAVEALNAHAAYYLVKPVNIEDLQKAVNYVVDIRQKEQELENRILKPAFRISEGKITIPQQDGFQVLEVADILFCQADDNYTHIHLENKKILVSKTLKYFEEVLSAFPFARVHKSFLVNVSAIVKYRKGKGGSVVLSNGKEILVAPARKKDLLAYFK